MPRLIVALSVAVLFGQPPLARASVTVQGGLYVVAAETSADAMTNDALFGGGSANGLLADTGSPIPAHLPPR